jgi:23S rRNA pseudouridine2605 synthase
MAKVSLDRALSKLGYCSRSQAQTLILAGRVRVNGSVCQSPSQRLDLNSAQITIDGKRITVQDRVYLMLNKPRGLVTSRSDEQGRGTVYECLADLTLPWLSPVGRLDKASEGLLLFTNDTQWAARILDPSSHLDKVYHVQINTLADRLLLQQYERGILVAGELLKAKRARLVRLGTHNSWVEIILNEGKNRHIRRMTSVLGLDVLRLIRTAIGPLKLGDLKKGDYRHLTELERKALGDACK